MVSRELFSLGALYPSDFLKPDEQPRCEPIELKLVMEDNGLVHLEKTAPKECMWGKYFYRSGINQSMKDALKDVVDSILPLMKIEENSIFLDIACNDGTLLSFVPNSFIKVGVDPADQSFSRKSEQYADLIIQDYFSADVYTKSKFGNQKVKCVTSIAVFYDLTEPVKFINDVYEILEDDGLWVMQISYSPLMKLQTAFDNILHEHWAYYDLCMLNKMLLDNNFKIMDCQLNDVNGGSMRLYIMKYGADYSKFGTQPYRDVCRFRVDSLLAYELESGVSSEFSWHHFFKNINKLKEDVVSFMKAEKKKGKTIWAYGASSKGNTLLQYFGLDDSLISGIAERNIDKWGLRTVGTNIPIYSESDMRKAQPDYLLLLPWHFLAEFSDREKDYLNKGGKFIVPCPKFEIISK